MQAKLQSLPKTLALHLLLLTLLILNSTSVSSQSTDHSCGASGIHNPALNYGQVIDIDGNSYKTVVIDNKVWFAENLKVARFQNGDSIPAASDSATWAGLTGPGMCSYRNDTTFDCPQGKLYNFFVASDTRNPCPTGWRVPSLTDFNELINFFDPNANGGAPSSLPNNAGGFLKSAGLTYWQAPNVNATNASGFSATPIGSRNNSGVFSNSNNLAAGYWYSSQVGPGMGFFLELAYTQDYAVRNAYFAKYGICIRCVTDLSTQNIHEIEASEIRIYPNPASNFVTISGDKSVIGKEYTVLDLTGRLIITGSVTSENTTISIEDLPAGMYYLNLRDVNGSVFKILKH